MARVRSGKWEGGSLSEAWEQHAGDWVTWARAPGHDSYWKFHRDQFLNLLPSPPATTLDVGCGEGRLPRDLSARGYEVTGLEYSTTLLAAARAADPQGRYVQGDARQLPFRDESFDLVTGFLSFHDFDGMPAAMVETARVLRREGQFCMATVHPLNSSGQFETTQGDAPFIIRGSYLDEHKYFDEMERDGLRMTFVSRHYPMHAWFDALAEAGLVVEAVREPRTDDPKWSRVPLFLHIRAKKS